jgi:hypothetical protein
MMTNEMHQTRRAIIMTLSLSLSVILETVIFLSSIENNNDSIIYAQFQNNNSNISLGVNITSPQRGQQIPISTSSLNLSGKSTDNPTADDCQVSVIVNDVKPYQPATANGNIGAKNDYSKWFFILGSNYTSINEGTNEITAKLSCLSNSLNNNNNATKWYSINVTGVTTTNNITVATQSSPVINSSTQYEMNNDEPQYLDEEQEEPLVDTTDKNAKNVMKEEIRNFRERIMDEVEERLKEQGIELDLP